MDPRFQSPPHHAARRGSTNNDSNQGHGHAETPQLSGAVPGTPYYTMGMTPSHGSTPMTVSAPVMSDITHQVHQQQYYPYQFQPQAPFQPKAQFQQPSYAIHPSEQQWATTAGAQGQQQWATAGAQSQQQWATAGVQCLHSGDGALMPSLQGRHGRQASATSQDSFAFSSVAVGTESMTIGTLEEILEQQGLQQFLINMCLEPGQVTQMIEQTIAVAQMKRNSSDAQFKSAFEGSLAISKACDKGVSFVLKKSSEIQSKKAAVKKDFAKRRFHLDREEAGELAKWDAVEHSNDAMVTQLAECGAPSKYVLTWDPATGLCSLPPMLQGQVSLQAPLLRCRFETGERMDSNKVNMAIMRRWIFGTEISRESFFEIPRQKVAAVMQFLVEVKFMDFPLVKKDRAVLVEIGLVDPSGFTKPIFGKECCDPVFYEQACIWLGLIQLDSRNGGFKGNLRLSEYDPWTKDLSSSVGDLLTSAARLSGTCFEGLVIADGAGGNHAEDIKMSLVVAKSTPDTMCVPKKPPATEDKAPMPASATAAFEAGESRETPKVSKASKKSHAAGDGDDPAFLGKTPKAVDDPSFLLDKTPEAVLKVNGLSLSYKDKASSLQAAVNALNAPRMASSDVMLPPSGDSKEGTSGVLGPFAKGDGTDLLN